MGWGTMSREAHIILVYLTLHNSVLFLSILPDVFYVTPREEKNYGSYTRIILTAEENFKSQNLLCKTSGNQKKVSLPFPVAKQRDSPLIGLLLGKKNHLNWFKGS